MTPRKSQLTKSAEIHKPVSKNEKSELAQSYGSLSQRGILPKTNNSIKGNGVDSKLVLSKDTTPRPTKEEINRLAKAWCEMLLGQVMEERNQQIDRCQ